MSHSQNEDNRLKELHRYYILDTQPEAAFDEITKLAAIVCEMKMASIGLVDKDRQWFKSTYGIKISTAPRTRSFTDLVIEQDDIFIIPDITQDIRFKNYWAVTEQPSVRFYAGIPLITPKGHKIGALSVADNKPRELNEIQINFLKSLAKHIVDILELRSKSRELEKLEAQFLDVQKSTKTGGWELNVQTQEVNWSPEIYEIFGIPSGTPTVMHDTTSFFAPHERERIVKMVSDAAEFGKPYHGDFDFTDAQGVEKCVRAIGRPVVNDQGKIVRVVGTFQDITEHRQSQLNYLKRKAASEQKFSSLLESMSEGVVILDMSANIIQHNTSAMAIVGLTSDELTGKKKIRAGWRAIKEDGSDFRFSDHPAIFALKTGKSIFNVKMGIRLNAEETRWIIINAVALEHPEGRRVLCTFSNITALVHAIEENKFVFEALGIGVWKANLGMKNGISWDHSMYNIYGVTPRDFDGSRDSWMSFLTDESRAFADQIGKDIEKGANDFTTTYELKNQNHGVKYVGGRGRVIRNAQGIPVGLYGITWDRTKEVELEKNFELERAKALHTSKLASIGQLAAGVGHEINNPLSIISGHIRIAEQLLQNEGIEKNDLLERFNKVNTSVTRIANIVKGLRTFARSDDNLISKFDLFDPLKESVDLLKEIYHKEGVELSIHGDRRCSFINGNRGRIQQVMVNLITNAKDASADKEVRKIDIGISYTNDSLKMTFADNGSGIPVEIRNKIFEPFFTTKPINQGTGLGLPLVSTIVKEHLGKIEFDSEINKGTTFTLTFPVSFAEESDEDIIIPVQNFDEKLPCKVLIVDDENDLREILQFLFAKKCSVAKTAADVKSALHLMESEEFDLVVSDINMPEVNGFTFLKKIRENKSISQPKFIFITGGVDFTEAEQTIVRKETHGILSKPFKEDAVSEKLKELYPDKFI